MAEREITGVHVAAIFGTAFAVIIGVNVTLAVQAVRTFPGLETRNSYVTSQAFQRDRTAQDALGWTVGAEISDGQLVLHIDGAEGPVFAKIASATLGRATHVAEDRALALTHTGSAFVADVPGLAPGNWNLRLVAEAPDGTPFRQRIIVRVQP